jgi:HEAT repeat protein
MKQRSTILAAMAMMPLAVAVAQTPPRPTTPVTPPALPAPVVSPAPLVSINPLPFDIYIDRDAIRRLTDDARWQGQLAAEEGRRLAEQGRLFAEEARFSAQAALADSKLHFDNFDFRFDVPAKLSNFAYAPAPMAQVASAELLISGVGRRQQWQDPADSAYEVAASAFNRQDYSRAAAKFAEMMAKYPNSRRVSQAAYYQAFALYRVGTLESLRSSLKVLETNAQRFEYDYNRSYRTEAPALQARVLRALAARNEPSAEGKLRDLVAKYPAVTCDDEQIRIQTQVLNSLHQADPESAMPYIRQYLQTRDGCNAELRRTAVWLLGNRPSAENTAAIVNVARTDTVRSVRSRAVEVLSRMPGDDAVTALQQLMQDPDEQIQSAAVRSLMRSDNPKARAAMRTLIARRDASERQRLDAIRSFDRENTSPDDANYLRGLFNRAGESDRIKEAVIQAIAQLPTEENLKFLMDVAQNPNETSSVRSSALRRVTARQNLTTDNLIKLYDASDNRSMRNSLVEALGQRPEAAAVNKLLDIVKFSTDVEVRGNAIQVLLRKKDPAITQKVLDLIK